MIASTPSDVYYLQTGIGRWAGEFSLRIKDWRLFRSDRIAFVDRLLALGMWLTGVVFGRSHIASVLKRAANEDVRAVVENVVRISKLGMTLYVLRERYVLDTNGRDVLVRSHERFGPFPFLLNRRKQHPAEILDGGRRAVYYIPLLGTEWVGTYRVLEDRRHISATLECGWAEAREEIHRAG